NRGPTGRPPPHEPPPPYSRQPAWRKARVASSLQPSDEALVRSVRAGDETAARVLFDRHLPALRAKARARLPAALRGKVAESDVIQDAWLAAFLDLSG